MQYKNKSKKFSDHPVSIRKRTGPKTKTGSSKELPFYFPEGHALQHALQHALRRAPPCGLVSNNKFKIIVYTSTNDAKNRVNGTISPPTLAASRACM